MNSASDGFRSLDAAMQSGASLPLAELMARAAALRDEGFATS